MLKSLFPQIDWDSIAVVGFDMDGTLYDETDFIAQVYHPIAARITAACGGMEEETKAWMLTRWREKGSSYNRIFDEAIRRLGKDASDDLIRECVGIFRAFQPTLKLPEAIRSILNEMQPRYGLFLVSDGSDRLQRAKFQSLGLAQWIAPENVAISGTYGAEFQKPSTRMIPHVALLNGGPYPSQVVYFGDRDCDQEFAANAGFSFVKVKCMKPAVS